MKTDDSHFVFVGNHAAIDFVNTRVMQRGELIDLLGENTDLLRWAQEAGRVLDGELTASDLAVAKDLRAALAELFLAKMEERRAPQAALATVNRHLAEHASHGRLHINAANGELELVPGKGASSLTALLAGLAHEAAQLLTSTQAAQVKRCGNAECVLLFLDTSRTRKRRWCSMDICGNRAKAAKHYQKQMR